MTKRINKTQPVELAFANGQDIKVHAAGCADLNKAATKREAYNGIYTQTFPVGTTERDVWIDFNEDFLAEGGADAAWPMEFLPCCKPAGLVADSDRTWDAEPEVNEVIAAAEETLARVEAEHPDVFTGTLAAIVAYKDDKAQRNAQIVAALDGGEVTAKQIADMLGIEARAVREAADRYRARTAA